MQLISGRICLRILQAYAGIRTANAYLKSRCAAGSRVSRQPPRISVALHVLTCAYGGSSDYSDATEEVPSPSRIVLRMPRIVLRMPRIALRTPYAVSSTGSC
eukprot:1329325-Rhodomonas_salina.2